MSTLSDDGGDTKDSPTREPSGRVRVSIACQHCRTRKIKCDGEVPCRKCTESGIICQPGAKRKKRAPSRKDQYIRELEKKLQDLQTHRQSPSPSRGSSEQPDDDDGGVGSSHDRPVFSNIALYKQGTRQMSEYQYFGASSALSSIEADAFGPPSRSGSMQAGFGKDIEMEEGENPVFVSYHGTDSDLDTNFQAVQAQLPSADVVQLYIDKYFTEFAPRCPLLNEIDFRARAEVFLRDNKEGSPSDSFIGTFLMVLCFGEYCSSGDTGTENVRLVAGWRFFLSAYSGARDGLRRSNIEYMQSIALQVLYLQTIAKLSVAYVLLGNLIRVMQASGMHRAQDVNTPEGIARTNLMNIIYILEKQLALSLGRPSMIQDFDCDFHTPSPPAANEPGRSNGALAVPVHLARIAGEIHRLLYSPEAARSSTQTYLQNIEKCESELERWRTSYMPSFPEGGEFRHQSEVSPEIFDDGFRGGLRGNIFTYMYLLCNVRRANPVLHTLNDGTKVPGMDEDCVDTAIAFIRLIHVDQTSTDPSSWLAVNKCFTASAILYQSLKAKAVLLTQGVPPANLLQGARLQINALRALETLFRSRIRGYTGAARYFAQVMSVWIDQFETAFNIPRPGGMPPRHEGHFTPQGTQAGGEQHPPVAMSLAMSRSESLGAWSASPGLQPYGQYLPPEAAPLPSPNAPAAAAFSPAYRRGLSGAGGGLALTTATNDYQGAYNWAPPAHYGEYGYGPDPPSAVGDDTDFSGAEMFEGAGAYRNFVVGDLMMPAWMPGQTRGPDHP